MGILGRRWEWRITCEKNRWTAQFWMEAVRVEVPDAVEDGEGSRESEVPRDDISVSRKLVKS